jgi:hypothetical protein
MPQNVKTDDDGRVRVGVKRNDYGTGYSFYAPDGLQGQQIAVTARAAVQTFEGAADLNYPPARAGGTLVMPIWCAPHRPIHLAKGFGEVEYEITDPTGFVVVPRGSWKGETRARGWHRLMAYATTADEQPYKVTAEYWATRSIAKGE